MRSEREDIIHDAILAVAANATLLSGNCAAFAVVLDRVLDGGGQFAYVESGHYAFADHVALRLGDRLVDGEGVHDETEFRDTWCQEDEDGECPSMEELSDPAYEYVLRLADSSGSFTAPLNMSKVEAQIRRELNDRGYVFDDTSNAASIPLSCPAI